MGMLPEFDALENRYLNFIEIQVGFPDWNSFSVETGD
jgi:hypothetical protein